MATWVSSHLGAFVIVLGEILLSWHDPRIRQGLEDEMNDMEVS